MHHCVVTYGPACRAGRCSIWTVEVQDRRPGARVRPMLTVEVREGAIVQARGRANAAPRRKALAVLRRWAAVASMQLAGWC